HFLCASGSGNLHSLYSTESKVSACPEPMRMHKVQERSPGTIFRFHSHFKKTRMYERRDHSDPEEGQSKSVSKSTWTTRQKTVEMLAQIRRKAAVNIREKCTCIAVAKSVLLRRITDFKIIDSAPLCDKVQIIVHLASRPVCLAPNSKQGKKLQKCWKRIKFNERKKKSCLKSGKAKQRPKKPKAT
ncbi:hypothetical protein QTP70_020143, partial [Hemibagrus guttatus]